MLLLDPDKINRQHIELLREAASQRLARAVQQQQPHNWPLYRVWAYQSGVTLERWGKRLARFGTLDGAYAPHEASHSYKTVHISAE